MRLVVLTAVGLLAVSAQIGAAIAGDNVSFPGGKADGYFSRDIVSAEFRPASQPQGKSPAVVILHGSGGIDGRGQFHADALNAAGIATLEVYMFDRGKRPREGHVKALTHGYGALQYLAARGDIDPKRIGALGFSFGANLTMHLAEKSVSDAFLPSDGPRYAAHAPFYPACWVFSRKLRDARRPHLENFTPAPMLIFAGGEDDYGEPDDCQRFLNALPEADRAHIAVQFYPTATHGWDTPGRSEFVINDPASHGGFGGMVRFRPDPAIAEDSRQRMVAFFRSAFRMNE